MDSHSLTIMKLLLLFFISHSQFSINFGKNLKVIDFCVYLAIRKLIEMHFTYIRVDISFTFG